MTVFVLRGTNVSKGREDIAGDDITRARRDHDTSRAAAAAASTDHLTATHVPDSHYNLNLCQHSGTILLDICKTT